MAPHLGLGNERNGRHWFRADIFRSSATSHTTAMMVTTFPGPLYRGERLRSTEDAQREDRPRGGRRTTNRRVVYLASGP